MKRLAIVASALVIVLFGIGVSVELDYRMVKEEKTIDSLIMTPQQGYEALI